jgi:hypothetical protein
MVTHKDTPKKPRTPEQEAREQRLKAQLRANLKRRKATKNDKEQ